LASPSPLYYSTHSGVGREPIQLPRNRRVTMFALACLIFFTTCGGAFGLEPLVGAVGPGLAVVLIILTPVVWSLPTALMVAELATLMPEEGGWENASTYAGEVDNPQRNYPRALALGLLVLVLCYLFPVVAGITVTSEPAIWSSDAGWPVIAQLIGGRWLGKLLAAAGLVSMWGLFNAQLLYVSRLPYVLACDGWLPKFLAKVSPKASVPRMAIVCFSAIGALFAAFSFGSLAVIQCLLYSGALTLEFLALLVLRVRRPHADRSFRVPGGWFGMAYVCMSPFAFAALLLFATLRDWRSFPGQLFVVGAILGIGVGLYFVRRRVAVQRSGGGFPQVSSSPPI
jgi:amino acid transporter